MQRHILICVLAGLLLGCGQNSQPKAKRGTAEGAENKGNEFHGAQHAKMDDSGGDVRLQSLTLTAPKGWPRKPPQSDFIVAEYVLPRAEGDSRDGRLTLSAVGGSIDDNIERWKGQFSGKPEKAHQEKLDVNGLSITVVDLSGEFNDQPGPFAQGVKRPGHRMIGAIIPVGNQLHFVKAVGPQRTMDAHADRIMAFIRSTRT